MAAKKTRYSIREPLSGGRLVLDDWVRIFGGDYEGYRGQITSFPTSRSANVHIPDLGKTVKLSNNVLEFVRAG